MTRTITNLTVFWDDAPRFGVSDAGWAFRAEGADLPDELGYGVIAGCADDDLDGAIDLACHILDLDLTHDDFGRDRNVDGGYGTWSAE